MRTIFNYDDFIKKMDDLEIKKQEAFREFKKAFQSDVENILKNYVDKTTKSADNSYFWINNYLIFFSNYDQESISDELKGNLNCYEKGTFQWLNGITLKSNDEDLENRIEKFVEECRRKIIEKDTKKFNI